MSALLHTKLKEHLVKSLQSLKMISQSSDKVDEECQIQVFIGDLPPKQSNKGQQSIPCVVIVPLSGHQENGSLFITLALICIVYGSDTKDAESAEADLALLLSSIIECLAPFSQGTPLAKRFELQPDSRNRILPWVKSENQARSFLQATMTSIWSFKGWE